MKFSLFSEYKVQRYWDWRTGSRNHEIQTSGLASVHWPTHPSKNRSKQLNRNKRSHSKGLFVSTSKRIVTIASVVQLYTDGKPSRNLQVKSKIAVHGPLSTEVLVVTQLY